MNLQEWLRQGPQETQEVESVPTEPKTLDAVAAQFDAEKYREIVALLDEGIEAGEPPADVLQRLTIATYGENSPQAAKLAETVKTAPGGPELAIATIRAHKAIIRAELKKLQALSKPLMDDLARLDDEERDVRQAAGDMVNKALLEIMEVATSPEPPTLHTLADLYTRHKGNRRAMGLLYGVIADTARQTAGELDMVDAQHLMELQEQALEAVKA